MVWLWKSGRRYEKSQKPPGVGFGWVCLIIFGKHGPTFKEEKTHQDGRCPWLYWTFKLYFANMSRKSQFFKHTWKQVWHHHSILSSHPRRTCYFQHPMPLLSDHLKVHSTRRQQVSLLGRDDGWRQLGMLQRPLAAVLAEKEAPGRWRPPEWRLPPVDPSILKWNWKRWNFKMNRGRERERDERDEKDEKESIGHQRF